MTSTHWKSLPVTRLRRIRRLNLDSGCVAVCAWGRVHVCACMCVWTCMCMCVDRIHSIWSIRNIHIHVIEKVWATKFPLIQSIRISLHLPFLFLHSERGYKFKKKGKYNPSSVICVTLWILTLSELEFPVNIAMCACGRRSCCQWWTRPGEPQAGAGGWHSMWWEHETRMGFQVHISSLCSMFYRNCLLKHFLMLKREQKQRLCLN